MNRGESPKSRLVNTWQMSDWPTGQSQFDSRREQRFFSSPPHINRLWHSLAIIRAHRLALTLRTKRPVVKLTPLPSSAEV
jgi:hypothetical protein